MLPRVSDYPDLTPCQRQRVRDAIHNILTPHEQEHVTAFNRYNGTTSRRFDLTLCRNNFESTIRSMFEGEERARRQAAQAASDALDPFYFDVDLNCEDSPEAGREKEAAGEGE
jgi:predicted nucleic acid-binding OB-fold protein